MEEIKDKVRRQNLRIVYTVQDLEYARHAIRDLSGIAFSDDEISKSELRSYKLIEMAMVVSYGRPFSQSRGLPKFSFEMIGMQPSEEELNTHRELMRLRDQVFAHSDFRKMRVKTVVEPLKDIDIDLPYYRAVFDEGLHFHGDRYLLVEKWLNVLFRRTLEHIFTGTTEDLDAWRFDIDCLQHLSQKEE